MIDNPKNKIIKDMKNLSLLIQTDSFEEIEKGFKDLIKFSNMLELKDEVFVSEVLETIFNNVKFVLTNSSVKNTELEQLKKELSTCMDEIIDSCLKGNTQKLYVSLRQIRFITTQFQLKIRPSNTKGRYYTPEGWT